MSSQIAPTCESLEANFALVWSLTCMNSFVIFKIIGPYESFWAFVAFEWSFTSVYHHMHFQGILSFEFLITMTAGEWHLSTMPSYMCCEIFIGLECLWANSTLVRLSAAM